MKIIRILAVLLLSFFAGAFVASWILWPVSDVVNIRVINDSEIIPVQVSGESSYLIIASFENGTSVGVDGRYVEPEYRIIETVTENKIQYEVESFH